MKKLSLGLVLIVAALCLLWPASRAQAAETVASGTCGTNITWTLDDSGTLTISGTGEMEDYVLSGAGVNYPWQAYRNSITRIVMEDGITSIGRNAFTDLAAVTEVSLPESVTYIGTNAFYNCVSLEEIKLPDSTGYIDNRAFAFCLSLSEIVIPDKVQYLGSSAFQSCSSVSTVTIGTGVAFISSAAFDGCYRLTDITFRGDRPSVSQDIFPAGTFTLHYPKDNATWDPENDFPDSGGNTFLIWEACDPFCQHEYEEYCRQEVTCTTDGYVINKCHCGHTHKEITTPTPGHIPARDYLEATCTAGGHDIVSCSTCGKIMYESYQAAHHVFADGLCTRCGEALPEEIIAMGDCGPNLQWFLDVEGVLTISGYGGMTSASGWMEYSAVITTVIIEEGATNICSAAFANHDALTSVTIPDSVTAIYAQAFENCNLLTDVQLGSGLQSVGREAFASCKKLANITLPDSVTSIEELAFSYCESLLGISIPDGVPSLGRRAFYQCTTLAWISLPNINMGIDGETFYGCQQLWHVLVRDGKELSYLSLRTLRIQMNMATFHSLTDDAEMTAEYYHSTCSEYGFVLVTCPVCQHMRQFTLPLAEHTWKEATCTDPKTCQACGKTLGKALGGEHVWDEGVIVQPATEDQVGVRQYRCSVCQDTKLEMFEWEPEPSASGETREPLSPTVLFLLIIGGLVVVIGGVALIVVIRQRRA